MHLGRCIIGAVAAPVFLLAVADGRSGPSLQPVPRDEILSRAKSCAELRWVCNEVNRHAPCVTKTAYTSDWMAGQEVVGLPYDWGGMDPPDAFIEKLARRFAAGSHSQHGATECTAGIDCSGLVSYCWGQSVKYSTQSIRNIAARPRYNWYTDMKPGDALNKPGSHIVLFTGYRPDGNPIVYEASGTEGRVIRNDWSTWSRFRSYYPLRYRTVIDD